MCGSRAGRCFSACHASTPRNSTRARKAWIVRRLSSLRPRAALRALLQGEQGAYRDAVLLNAAVALVVADAAADLREGMEEAAETIDRGLANALLNCWIAYS